MNHQRQDSTHRLYAMAFGTFVLGTLASMGWAVWLNHKLGPMEVSRTAVAVGLAAWSWSRMRLVRAAVAIKAR
jgi:hypothetical protein